MRRGAYCGEERRGAIGRLRHRHAAQGRVAAPGCGLLVKAFLSRKSVVTPKTAHLRPYPYRARTARPSHLLTDWRVTPSCSASSSCDQPAFLRRAVILSANIIREVLRLRRARRLFDGQSIPLFAVADKKDGQEDLSIDGCAQGRKRLCAQFFRNGSPWASICGTYSKGERRCW